MQRWSIPDCSETASFLKEANANSPHYSCASAANLTLVVSPCEIQQPEHVYTCTNVAHAGHNGISIWRK